MSRKSGDQDRELASFEQYLRVLSWYLLGEESLRRWLVVTR